MASSALMNTVFAQRMALKAQLLEQAKAEAQRQDALKLRAMELANQSTQIANQGAMAAIAQRRADAQAIAANEGFSGGAEPNLEEEEGTVQDAAQIGFGEGQRSFEAFKQRADLAQMKEQGQWGRAELRERGAMARTGANIAQRQEALQSTEDRWAQDYDLRRQAGAREEAFQPTRTNLAVAQTGFYNRSPMPYQGSVTTPEDKRYTAALTELRSQTERVDTEYAKLQAEFGGIGTTINKKQADYLLARKNALLQQRLQILIRYSRTDKGAQDTELTQELVATQEKLDAIRQGKDPDGTLAPSPEGALNSSSPDDFTDVH